jgi:hypothetical protein
VVGRRIRKGGFFCTAFNTGSSAAPQIPMCLKIMGLNPVAALA